MSTTKYVLERRQYLLQSLPNSISLEHILLHGVEPNTHYLILVDCVPDFEQVKRVCKRIADAAAGCKATLGNLVDAQQKAVERKSAFANTLRPDANQPLLKASALHPWHTVLMHHVFGKDIPAKTLILYGPPGCGKTLALERIRRLLKEQKVPVMYVSGAETDESDVVVSVRQYLCTLGSAPSAVLIVDDANSFANGNERTALFKLISTGRCRRVIVCNDRYVDYMRALCNDKKLFQPQEVVKVDHGALYTHLQTTFPTLVHQQIDEIIGDAHGDVRAAQLAAEMQSLVPQKLTAGTIDDHRHGAPHTDILRCTRAERVIDACAQLLQPRAVDAAQLMYVNYPRLADESMMDSMAEVAEFQSLAVFYEWSVAEGENAYTFAKQTPDDTVTANVKEQIVFDLAVVAPCVTVKRAASVKRNVKMDLDWPYGMLAKRNRRVAAMCRDLDARHEMLMRTTIDMANTQHGGLTPGTLDGGVFQDVIERAEMRTGAIIARAHGRVELVVSESSNLPHAQEDGATDEPDASKVSTGSVPMSAFVTIDRLERTLFVFRLLVGNAQFGDAKQRRALIANCARYGFTATEFAYAASMFVSDITEDAAKEFFDDANAPVLFDRHAAAIMAGADDSGVVHAVRHKRKSPAAGAAELKSTTKKTKKVVVAAGQTTLQDLWRQKMQRPSAAGPNGASV